MNFSHQFQPGTHHIGYISEIFKTAFADAEFEPRPLPTFQKLPRAMNDETIESELKPGLCELGDVLAFLDNAPDECKDGYANLFYFPAFVVSVYWYGDEWYVGTWKRVGSRWYAGRRVFSPATVTGGLEAEDLGALTLETLNSRLEKIEHLINPELLI